MGFEMGREVTRERSEEGMISLRLKIFPVLGGQRRRRRVPISNLSAAQDGVLTHQNDTHFSGLVKASAEHF